MAQLTSYLPLCFLRLPIYLLPLKNNRLDLTTHPKIKERNQGERILLFKISPALGGQT